MLYEIEYIIKKEMMQLFSLKDMLKIENLSLIR